MHTFLNSVVEDLISKVDDFSLYTIVLPSKRSGVFLKRELKDSIRKASILPKIISIEEFIQNLSNLYLISHTKLIFEFYSTYRLSIRKKDAQPFDAFYNWAPTLLADFNEIDSHLADSEHIFSYLNDIKHLEKLLDKNGEETDLIKKQFQFYEKLQLYYSNLRKHLLKKGIAYQGMQYREAAENLQLFIDNIPLNTKIVFVGFNALNKAEEIIFQELLNNNIATIYWDIDKFFYEKNDISTSFIKKYFTEWNYYTNNKNISFSNSFSDKKNIKIIGAPKKISQIKYTSELLSTIGKNGYSKTALVMADETLLVPVLNSFPKEVESVNITMGYELKHISIFNLFELLFKLHINSKNERFYHKNITSLLNLPLIKSCFNDENSCRNLIGAITKNNYIYLLKKDLLKLSQNGGLASIMFIFENWNNNADIALQHCLKLIDTLKDKITDGVLIKEYLFRFHTAFQELRNLNEEYGYIKDIKTLQQFYYQIIKKEKLFFKGEPLSGLQIMGMLETRALDFENIIITSVNEGILPSARSDTSFIPYDIKKEEGLPTYREKDAIFSYHFFRLIQRAKNIYLLYNTESDDYGYGEQSRFITQLELYKEDEIEKQVVSSKVSQNILQEKFIAKSDQLQVSLKDLAVKGISPTSLTTYILNPFEFYKQKILKINELEEVEETVASNTLGNIIHKTLETLYIPYKGLILTEGIIKDLHNKSSKEVDKWFSLEYMNGNITTGKNLLIYNVAQQFITNFLNHELDLIKKGNEVKIIELEYDLHMTLEVGQMNFPIKLVGKVDRIDQLNGITRIIDYKTGKVEQHQLIINNWDLITTNYDKYSKSFQVLFYALIYSNMLSPDLNTTPLQSGIISFKNLRAGFMKVNKRNITESDLNSFKKELEKLIIEVFNPNIQFIDNQASYKK